MNTSIMKITSPKIPYLDSYVQARYYTPKPDTYHPVVIKFHGLPGKPLQEEDKGLASYLTNAGIAYLAFDFTGTRESPGTYTVHDALGNAHTLINWVLKQPNVNPLGIGIYGESFGAVMATSYAVRDQRIRALALRVPVFNTKFISKLESFKHVGEIIEDSGAMKYPKGELKKIYEEQTKHNNPWDLIPYFSPRPLLVLGSSKDQLIPPDGVYEFYKKAKQPKEYHEIKGADHNLTDPKHQKQAYQILTQFYKKILVENNIKVSIE